MTRLLASHDLQFQQTIPALHPLSPGCLEMHVMRYKHARQDWNLWCVCKRSLFLCFLYRHVSLEGSHPFIRLSDVDADLLFSPGTVRTVHPHIVQIAIRSLELWHHKYLQKSLQSEVCCLRQRTVAMEQCTIALLSSILCVSSS